MSFFNPQTAPDLKNFDVLPAGKYPMMATSQERKIPKSEIGHYYEFVFEIIDGEHKGRKIWHRHTVDGTEGAQNYSLGMMKSFCKAIGQLEEVDSPDTLLNRPFLGEIKVKAAEGNYSASNDMKGFFPIEQGYQPPAPTKSQAPQPQGGEKPIWEA